MKAAGGVAPVKELLLWETFGGGGAVRLIEVAPDVWRVEIEDGNKEQSPFDFSFGCDELRALAVAAGRGVVLDGVRRDVLRIAAQLPARIHLHRARLHPEPNPARMARRHPRHRNAHRRAHEILNRRARPAVVASSGRRRDPRRRRTPRRTQEATRREHTTRQHARPASRPGSDAPSERSRNDATAPRAHDTPAPPVHRDAPARAGVRDAAPPAADDTPHRNDAPTERYH